MTQVYLVKIKPLRGPVELPRLSHSQLCEAMQGVSRECFRKFIQGATVANVDGETFTLLRMDVV